MAEWLRSGLQIREPRFNSGRGLHPNFPKFRRRGGRINLVKCLLTLDRHHGQVFLEDTPPLPNALGPGSHPASFFCLAMRAKSGLQGGKFPLVLAQGTR